MFDGDKYDVERFNVEKIEKRNRKLRSVRNKYRVISILGAVFLIVYTIIILKTIFFNNSEEIEIDQDDQCKVLPECLDFMKSQNLTVGEFTIVCNITATDVP